MHLPLTLLAAAYGASVGLLVPRAAYRLAVEPAEPWRNACPGGHPLTGPARGWLGRARCAACGPARDAGHIGGTGPADGPGQPRGTGTRERPGQPRGTGYGERPGQRLGTGSGDRPGQPEDIGSGDRPGQPAGIGSAEHPALPGQPTVCPGQPQALLGQPKALPAQSGRYGPAPVLTPVLAALVSAGLAAAAGPRPELGVWLLLVPFALVLALVDVAVHRLPDVLTLTLPAAAAALLGVAALLPGAGGSWPTALLGGVALAAVHLLMFVINPSGMGFGDVKLALTTGVALGWYGWPVLFAGTFAGFLIGAVYGLGLMALRRAGRKTGLPFGPFMICGTFLGLLLGGLAAS